MQLQSKANWATVFTLLTYKGVTNGAASDDWLLGFLLVPWVSMLPISADKSVSLSSSVWGCCCFVASVVVLKNSPNPGHFQFRALNLSANAPVTRKTSRPMMSQARGGYKLPCITHFLRLYSTASAYLSPLSLSIDLILQKKGGCQLGMRFYLSARSQTCLCSFTA